MSAPRNAVLVTGGSGFIGTALVARLLASGVRVFSTTTKKRPSGPHSPEWIEWDARAGELPQVPWAELDAVVHLASSTEGAQRHNVVLQRAINVQSPARLLDQAEGTRVRRFLLVSSGEALGVDSPAVVAEEQQPQGATTAYGAAKAEGEAVVRGWKGKTATAIVRLFHPYGPGGDRFLVNRLVHWIHDGTTVHLHGHDGLVLTPDWVTDVAAGLQAALASETDGIFHLAGAEQVTLRALCDQIGRALGREPHYAVRDEKPPGGHAASFERARKLLGHVPQVTIADGIRRLASELLHRERGKTANV